MPGVVALLALGFWAASSPDIPRSTLEARYATAIPGATLVVYPATGHLPQEEVPDQSAADVRAFLQAH